MIFVVLLITIGISYAFLRSSQSNINPEKNVIKYLCSKNNGVYQAPKTLGTNKYIELGEIIEKTEKINYKVKVWLDESADNTYRIYI